MKNSFRKKGSTLVEVLVSFGILVTTGAFIMGFLFKNPTTSKAWIDNYGQELSKTTLFIIRVNTDTIIEHIDANGFSWETCIKVTKQDDETCFHATSVRQKKDSTRILHFCKYGKTE